MQRRQTFYRKHREGTSVARGAAGAADAPVKLECQAHLFSFWAQHHVVTRDKHHKYIREYTTFRQKN